MFENDKIIVWEQVGRPKTPFVHKHIRDVVTVQLEPGKIEDCADWSTACR